MVKNKYLLSFIAYAILATVLIFSWFRYGHSYGGGDVGIPFYDPERILVIIKDIWWDAAAPGIAIPQGLTSVPFQFVQANIARLGLPFVIIQAAFFWMVIFAGGYGMFLVALNVFGKDKFALALLAGFFYELNPYMMIQVWHRFIHNTFFLAAALPFFFLFFRSWIRGGNFLSLLLFLLSNFIAVYLYGSMAFIVTVLVLLLSIFVLEILVPWKGLANTRLIVVRTFLGIVAWLAIHTWWILPVLNVAPAVLSSQHSILDNVSALQSISSQTIIPYSLLILNPFYLYLESDFGKIFNTYFFRFLPWIIFVFLIPGFIVALKNKKFIFWALFASLAILLSKGATSPFGYPYIFGFSNFFPLGVLRNPFEKLGILIPFSYAIIFSLGVNYYLITFKLKSKKFILGCISILFILYFFVFAWPLWGGKLFGKYNEPAFVEVPPNYIEADKFIKSQEKQGRILHLPLTITESAIYYWQFGYKGVESSQLYFNSLPSISRGFNTGFVDDALTALSYIFLLPDAENKILTLLQSFSIKFIILHKDMEWRGGSLPKPQQLISRLDNLSFLEKKNEFGDLSIYELKDEYFSPKIKITNNVQFFLPGETNIYWPWLLSADRVDLLSPLQGNFNLPAQYGSNIVAFPERVYSYAPEKIVKENLLGEMTAAKVLPDSPLYSLIRLKEKVQYMILPSSEKFTFRITLMGKRLVEGYLLQEKGSTKSIIPLIKEYQQILPQMVDKIDARSRGIEGEKEISIKFILFRHLAMLNLLKEKASSQEKEVIDQAIAKLTDLIQSTALLPLYQLPEENLSSESLLISRFNLPTAGEYELLQAHKNIQNIYPNSLKTNKFQINTDIRELNGLLSDHFISYGSIDLPAGENEIGFNPTPSVNLAKLNNILKQGNVKQTNGEIEITSDKHDPAYIEFDIGPIHGGDLYQLTFDSLIQLGNKFTVQIIQDTDVEDPKNLKQKLFKDFHKDPYRHALAGNFFNFYLNPMTTKATIRFLITPWDGCNNLLAKKELCEQEDARYQYEEISKVLFRNIKVTKSLNNPLFLRANLSTSSSNMLSGTVEFTQKNAAFYFGTINLLAPGFLVFNESFHPGWELELSNGQKIPPHQKFLSNLYGNAWYIDRPGNYSFKLEFKPQKNVKNGILISIFSLFVVVAAAVKQRLIK